VTALLTALALWAGPTLLKLPSASGGTVDLEADRGKYSMRERRMDFTGAPVKLTRGDAVLTCRHLVALQDEADRITTATCEGDVRFVRADKVITCEKATYDDPAARLTCAGSPVLKSGAVIVTGNLLVYDLERDEATLDDVKGNLPGDQADAREKALQSRHRGGAR
jgi:lipopolysaccharide export system protein LptA